MLDVACGRGRGALAALSLGARVLGVDRSREALAALRAAAPPEALGRLATLAADLEDGRGLPVAAGRCGAVLVQRFLYRPLAPALEEALRPRGLLLYETFTVHQRDLAYGPSTPRFLLAPGELPTLFPRLDVIAHEEGWTDGPRPFAVARLAARRPGGPAAAGAGALRRG